MIRIPSPIPAILALIALTSLSSCSTTSLEFGVLPEPSDQVESVVVIPKEFHEYGLIPDTIEISFAEWDSDIGMTVSIEERSEAVQIDDDLFAIGNTESGVFALTAIGDRDTIIEPIEFKTSVGSIAVVPFHIRVQVVASIDTSSGKKKFYDDDGNTIAEVGGTFAANYRIIEVRPLSIDELAMYESKVMQFENAGLWVVDSSR